MADAGDLKSPARKGIWVQIPSGPVKNAGSETTGRNLVFHSRFEAENPPDLQSVTDSIRQRWLSLAPEVQAAIAERIQEIETLLRR
jgi:hypothetical protein